MARGPSESPTDTAFGAIPPGTVFAKDRGGNGPDIQFFDNAVENAGNRKMMESVGQLQFSEGGGSAFDPPQISAPDVQAISDFVSGRTNEPPFIPGLSPAPQQVPNQFVPQISQQMVAPALGAPPVPMPAQQPDYSAMLAPVLQAQQQQFQALIGPLQQQAQQQQALVNQLLSNQQTFMQHQQPQMRAQQLMQAGYDPENPYAQHLFDVSQRMEQLEQQNYAMQQHLSFIQQQAQHVVSRSTMEEKVRDTLAQKFPGRDVPKATVEHAAKLAVSLSQSLGQEAAFANALAGIMPLVAMIPEKASKATAHPSQGPTTQPQYHPGMTALAQLPQFQGASPQQLAAAFQAMQAASLQGAGAGRNPLSPVKLSTLESVLFN